MLPGKKYGAQDYLALGKRYWWIVALPTVIGAFGALIVSASQKDRYLSEMLVQIVPQNMPTSFVAPTVTVSTEERMGSLEAQVKSRSQLERLILEYNLYPEERQRLPMEDVVAKMRSAIQVQLIRPVGQRLAPADAFYIRFGYDDPALAATVTSALGGLFVRQNAEERVSSARRTSGFLQQELAEAKVRLEKKEDAMEQFRQRYAGRLPTQADFNLQAMQQTQAQLRGVAEAVARDRSQKLVLEQLYKSALAAPLPAAPAGAGGAPSDPTAAPVASLRQQLQTAQSRLEQLSTRLTSEHPDLRRQRRLVADLQGRVDADPPTPSGGVEVSRGAASPEELQRRESLEAQKAAIDNVTRQIAFNEAEERKLRATLNDYQSRLEQVPGVESQWISLTRDYETQKDTYDSLLRKSEDSKVAENLEDRQVGEQFKIVDPARVPVKPVWPVRWQNNAIGTGAGLGLGLALIGLLFFRDQTLRTEIDVLDVLALPVLALVPQVMSQAEQARRRRLRLGLASVVAVAVASGGYAAWALRLWDYVV